MKKNRNESKYERIIREIAKREGISEEEVREEMEKAIKYAYFQRNTNGNWDALFETDQLPSPEEFIAAISQEVEKQIIHCDFR